MFLVRGLDTCDSIKWLNLTLLCLMLAMSITAFGLENYDTSLRSCIVEHLFIPWVDCDTIDAKNDALGLLYMWSVNLIVAFFLFLHDVDCLTSFGVSKTSSISTFGYWSCSSKRGTAIYSSLLGVFLIKVFYFINFGGLKDSLLITLLLLRLEWA